MAEDDIEYRALTHADRPALAELANLFERDNEKDGFVLPGVQNWLNITVPEAISDGVSVVAVDRCSLKVIGYQAAIIIQHQEYRDAKGQELSPEVRNLVKSRELLLARFQNVDLFQRYNVDSIAFLRGLFVKEEYRGKGIATRLREQCLQSIQSKGIPLVVGQSLLRAQRIFERSGFKIISDISGESEAMPTILSYVKRL